jgi:hypothetical protein
MRDGSVYLDFDREAASFREAILSAIADVEKASIGARVVRVEPDELVTMAEIARRSGRSRESVRQLVSGLRGPGDFPPPVASLKQRSPIWRWTEVSHWLRESLATEDKPAHRKAGSAIAERDTGGWVAAVNAVLDVRRHVPDVSEARRLFDVLVKPPTATARGTRRTP